MIKTAFGELVLLILLNYVPELPVHDGDFLIVISKMAGSLFLMKVTNIRPKVKLLGYCGRE